MTVTRPPRSAVQGKPPAGGEQLLCRSRRSDTLRHWRSGRAVRAPGGDSSAALVGEAPVAEAPARDAFPAVPASPTEMSEAS